MKVLLLSPLPQPNGGIATWSNNVLSHYSKSNSVITIFHQNTALQSRRITNTRLFIRIIKGIKESIRIKKNLIYNLNSFSPDVIHLTSSASFALMKDLLLIRIARKKKIPVVIHFHFGRIPDLLKKKNWEWLLLKYTLKKTDYAIVIDGKSFAALEPLNKNKTVYIPNPISIELAEKAIDRKADTICKIEGRVIFVGHVTYNKGVYDLVEACVKIPEVKELFIVGPFEANIKNDLLNLAMVRDDALWLKFTGSLNYNDVINLIKQSNILILPSYTEGFPNVVLEAMALGCPVIASDVGAIPEMLGISTEKPCGICVPVKDIDKLKESIVEILSNVGKASLFGSNGIEKVLQSYTLSTVCSQYEKIWQKTEKNAH